METNHKQLIFEQMEIKYFGMTNAWLNCGQCHHVCAHAVLMAIVIQTETGNNSITEKQPEKQEARIWM